MYSKSIFHRCIYFSSLWMPLKIWSAPNDPPASSQCRDLMELFGWLVLIKQVQMREKRFIKNVNNCWVKKNSGYTMHQEKKFRCKRNVYRQIEIWEKTEKFLAFVSRWEEKNAPCCTCHDVINASIEKSAVIIVLHEMEKSFFFISTTTLNFSLSLSLSLSLFFAEE